MAKLMQFDPPYRWAVFMLMPPRLATDPPRWSAVVLGQSCSLRRALQDVLAICDGRSLTPYDSVTRCEVMGPQSGHWGVRKRLNLTSQAVKDQPRFGLWHLDPI